jgi:rRNA maturation endonuclease Nob1
MTDDTSDDRPTDEAAASTNTTGEEERSATYEYVWRCTGCKAQYDERPERCEQCGGEEFQRYREL